MRFNNVLVTGAAGLLGRYVTAALTDVARVSGLDVVKPTTDHGLASFTEASIEDADAVRSAMNGQDAVIHVAARPNIWSGSGSEIIHTNVTGTWNVLQAAEDAGVRRVVVTSSDSVVGYTVLQGAMLPPDYLPVDAAHPTRPTDAYAISKKLTEEMARAFVARGKIEVVMLRPVYVLYPEFECEVVARAADPRGYKGPAAGGRQPAGGGPMWHYVDPRDLAHAFALALDADEPGFGPYFITGPNTLAPEPTTERLARLMDGRRVPVTRPEIYESDPYAPLYDRAAARERLGFEPRHDLRRKLVGGRS
ncbi:MAG: NAD(P)-dependent oxidoreductase [Hyphomicrobiaceae bacterium]